MFFKGSSNNVNDIADDKRFDNVFIGAQFDGLYGRLNFLDSGHHNDLGIWVHGLESFQKFNTAGIR